MKLILCPLVLSALVVGAQAHAQDEGEGQPFPAQESQTETQTMRMRMGAPGAEMNIHMNVQTTTTHQTGFRRDLPPPPVARDCGTGNDAGCSMTRRGELPMDAETFRGFLQSLRATENEISRNEIATATLKSNCLTAIQLGMVLDLFDNEITRFDVAKDAAPQVVNPKHALGLSTKFPNSIYAADYSKLMTGQR